MNNFTLQRPTKIIFGKGQICAIANEIPPAARLMITYGSGSIKKNGILDQVHKVLAKQNAIEFGGIQPNPDYHTLLNAVEQARTHKVDFLLAVGGGSVIDGTKFIAAAIPFPSEPWEIMATHGATVRKAIPFGCVVTLPATGSEWNDGAVISRRDTRDKLDFHSPLVMPRFSVLDPTTSYSLPPRQIANGVVDAFAHVIEQYLTYPFNAKVQDRLAEGILSTLIEEGPRALVTPEDYDVRANIMWAAAVALCGQIGAGVPEDWASHAIGHELTAMHGLDHAQTLAILLPALLRDQRDCKHEKLLQYAERVWHIASGSEAARVDAAIEKTQDFFEAMGIPTHLSDYGLDGSSIPALIKKLREHGMTALGEHRSITLDASRRILEAAR
jgi:NADP-dependent alcohol dehydrogenase